MKLPDRFAEVRVLGEGGMGRVYAVRDAKFDGAVRALKVLLRKHWKSEKVRRRFEEEVRATAQLKSDHVVQVLDYELGADPPWMLMELIEGQSLDDRVKQHGPLPLQEARRVASEIGHGLGAAHRAKLLHLDLKPGNIMLARRADVVGSTQVKVLDFGLSRRLRDDQTHAQQSQVMGTEAWMPPEQLERNSALRPSADVWSLGLVIFWMLTGRHYWRAISETGEIATFGSLILEMSQGAVEPASVRAAVFGLGRPFPDGFDAWFAKCVAAQEEHRWRDANEASAALDVVFSQGPVPSRPRSRKRWWIGGAAFALTLVVSAVGWQLWSSQAPATCEDGNVAVCIELGARYAEGRGRPRDEARAARLYQRACDGRAMLGCTRLGSLYADGAGVPRDAATAARLYQRACEGGERTGCNELGFLYDRGTGVPRDAARAVLLYQRACDGGEMLGCANLGLMLERGTGTARDPGRAVLLYHRACVGNQMLGCTFLGSTYESGTGVAKNLTLAAQLYHRACDGREMNACAYLGDQYEHGHGVARDLTRATALYQRACDGDSMPGCTSLGLLYENGVGVTRDAARALQLYQRACDEAHMLGCAFLGNFYEFGTAVPRDISRAVQLYQRACDGESMRGCAYLGFALEQGEAVARDVGRATQLYQRACSGGEMLGCNYLGATFENGVGTARDDARARALYRQACTGGEETGCENLRRLGG